MHDSAPPLRSRTLGIQRRVPALPMSEWPIKEYRQLPENLKRILDDYPPFLTTRRAAELNGGAVSKLYEHKDAGYVRCYKDGGSTLWDTMSIVLRLANLPVAASHAAPVVSTRRSRRQRVCAPSPAAVAAPPLQPAEAPPAGEQQEARIMTNSIIIEPIHTAIINDKPLRFFKSPHDRPDLPWHVPADLAKCFGLAEGLATAILHDMKTGDRWKDDVRIVATAEGLITIASHSVAQGFLGAMEEVGQISKGAFEAYAQAGLPAMDKLDLPPCGSPEFWRWMKVAVHRSEPDDRSIALNPGLAFIDAAEKYGEVVERDGERQVKIAMPDDSADEPPPPSPQATGDFDLDTVFAATRDALRRAAISDPVAVKELALDLAEVAMLEQGRKEGDPPRATKAAHRAARGIVGLRHRFNPNVLGLGKAPNLDSDPFKPSFDEKTGEEMYWVNEVGVWILLLPRFEEVEHFDNPELTKFRRFLIEFRERALKA